MITPEKKQYEAFAEEYSSVDELPYAKVEGELIRIALGGCTGCTVLDLGGGSGVHARKAVEAGAAVVDVFNVSPQMMSIGQELESAGTPGSHSLVRSRRHTSAGRAG